MEKGDIPDEESSEKYGVFLNENKKQKNKKNRIKNTAINEMNMSLYTTIAIVHVCEW